MTQMLLTVENAFRTTDAQNERRYNTANTRRSYGYERFDAIISRAE